MKHTYLFCLFALLLTGCHVNEKSHSDQWVTDAKKPIKLVAKSEVGGVTLQTADGDIITFKGSYYLSRNISATFEVGDIVFEKANGEEKLLGKGE
jgi:hypothetical protein